MPGDDNYKISINIIPERVDFKRYNKYTEVQMRKNNIKKGMHSIKTMSNTRKSTIPISRNSSFFELFILDKERGQLCNERNNLSVKLDVINNRLEEIEHEIKLLVQNSGLTDEQLKNEIEQATSENKAWKSISINY